MPLIENINGDTDIGKAEVSRFILEVIEFNAKTRNIEKYNLLCPEVIKF